MLHIIHVLHIIMKGKKIAMTWAYPPATASPCPCPGRHGPDDPFGMDVVLAHPRL